MICVGHVLASLFAVQFYMLKVHATSHTPEKQNSAAGDCQVWKGGHTHRTYWSVPRSAHLREFTSAYTTLGGFDSETCSEIIINISGQYLQSAYMAETIVFFIHRKSRTTN